MQVWVGGAWRMDQIARLIGVIGEERCLRATLLELQTRVAKLRILMVERDRFDEVLEDLRNSYIKTLNGNYLIRPTFKLGEFKIKKIWIHGTYQNRLNRTIHIFQSISDKSMWPGLPLVVPKLITLYFFTPPTPSHQRLPIKSFSSSPSHQIPSNQPVSISSPTSTSHQGKL